jgi:hypothetical protein
MAGFTRPLIGAAHCSTPHSSSESRVGDGDGGGDGDLLAAAAVRLKSWRWHFRPVLPLRIPSRYQSSAVVCCVCERAGVWACVRVCVFLSTVRDQSNSEAKTTRSAHINNLDKLTRCAQCNKTNPLVALRGAHSSLLRFAIRPPPHVYTPELEWLMRPFDGSACAAQTRLQALWAVALTV